MGADDAGAEDRWLKIANPARAATTTAAPPIHTSGVDRRLRSAAGVDLDDPLTGRGSGIVCSRDRSARLVRPCASTIASSISELF